MSVGTAESLLEAAKTLRAQLALLRFTKPVTHVYNPLEYAWAAYAIYLRKYANEPKRIIFLGMNPGPFGMVQTGVPFGEVRAVQEWLGVTAEIGQPERLNPKRPVQGFRCPRSEISGKRLWGLFASRFQTPERFFRDHVVMNYCPLAFMEETGRNVTPDKLAPRSRAGVNKHCDQHLRTVISILRPEWVVGVGGFAFNRASEVLEDFRGLKIAQILHPSPACPAANRDWAGTVERQLRSTGVWRQP